ncbi:MAG: hypothetical protein Q7R70_03455 [Candidatus Diapherotrites archaeon]|nr:hypothetical protein [Candidatus Diapherotrites archaeon]
MGIDFLKPNFGKKILFVIFAVISFFILSAANPIIFPCLARPVIPNPPAFSESICGFPFNIVFGASIQYTPVSMLLLAVFLLVIPYLLSCGVVEFFRKSSKN